MSALRPQDSYFVLVNWEEDLVFSLSKEAEGHRKERGKK